MKSVFFLLLALIIAAGIHAQSPVSYGFIPHHLITKTLGRVDFYVSDTLHDRQKPLLIYLDGSGNDPLFSTGYDSAGRPMWYSTVMLDLKRLALRYHILLISKPHTAFGGTATEEHTVTPDSVYDHYLSAGWRVRSASKAIDYVLRHYKVDRSRVVVFGYSEGGQVAPQLAIYNKRITHCIAFVGGGLNQFYDGIISNRMKAARGELSAAEAQVAIDSLYAQYAAIYANPASVKDAWYGHTYLRWSSFTETPVIEYFNRLKIPVYIAQGTADESTNVLSADYIRLEALRLRKTNLTMKVYPDCDHYFTNTKTGVNVLGEAIAAAFGWLEAE